MKYVLYFVIGYISLYAVVWLHEVGHALWLFMTLHIGEIVSYLLVGSIFFVSDMEIVSQYMPKLRLPNLMLGAILAVLYGYLLILVPEKFRVFVAIWNIVTVISMCVGRIIFTAIAKRRKRIQ